MSSQVSVTNAQLLRDPITFELLRNAIATIVDEMTLTIVRTAYSGNIRDAMDFSCALCDADGEMIAQGLCLALHLGSIPDAMKAVLAKYGDDVHPGDVFIMNDPYSGGMHVPDVFIFRPVFAADAPPGTRGGDPATPDRRRVLAYLVIVADQLDMGGRTPGNRAVDSTEIYQEGLRLPIMKFYEQGVPNQAIWDIIAANVRVPQKVHGDIRSQISACQVAERALLDLVDRYGAAALRAYFAEVLAYSERLTRREIAALPDGHHEFVDHVDDDSISDTPVRIQVALDVVGDELHFDLTGSSPQVQGAINSTFSFTKSAIYAATRTLFAADIPNNAGFFRPIKITAPEGTVVNPVLPGACNARGVTGFRVVDAALGALAQVAPDRVIAAGEGGTSSYRMGGYEPHPQGGPGSPKGSTRGAYVVFDGVIGTWGARPDRDGIDGCANFAGNIANVPVEVIESEFPVRINEYALRVDSGGPGTFRGGLGLVREWLLLGDEATATMRSDRRKYRPWGLHGGEPGAPSLSYLYVDDEEQILPSKVTFKLKRGQIFRHLQASGGGYGDPLERDPERVRADWRNEKVTLGHARDAYGVVIDPATRTVDSAATTRLRAARRSGPREDLNGRRLGCQ